MASLEELRAVRLAKLNKLKEAGMDPFTAISLRTHSVKQVQDSFPELMKGNIEVTLDGRIMSIRGQGAIIFSNITDGTGTFQTLLKKDEIDEPAFSLFVEAIDIADFIEVTGTLFETKTGQQTLLIKKWRILTKALAPLPDKWAGLVDDDERYRKRYLDILMNPELRELFEKKSKFWSATRAFMIREGFMEIETPTLEVTTGGAEARPFKTHHNDFDMPLYLRISVGELWQKKALAAGFPRVFEIGRVYRNEGSSPEHLQEFTNIEFYAAYMDYKSGMKFIERMWKEVLMETFGTLQFQTKDFSIDFTSDSWPCIEYVPYVKEKTGVDVLTASEDELRATLDKLGVVYEGANRERMIDSLWKYCRKSIAGPVWLINHPKIISPLAKSRPENPETVERCQLIVAGSEFASSYSELNNPIDQRERFLEQQKMLEGGDDEAMMPDWEFVGMLEHGMPPAFGSAPLGERLFAVLSGKPIRETQLFPLMKPKNLAALPPSKKDTMIAVAIVNIGIGLLPWQELNTVAHLNAAFGARIGKELFSQDTISSKDKQQIKLNIKNAIMIKKINDTSELRNLALKAKELGLEVDEFTREMIETTNDKKVIEITSQKNFDEIEYLGVLVYGSKDKIESLTEDLKMY